MNRRIGGIPAIAMMLDAAGAAYDVEPRLLKGQIMHGFLRGKRTSQPYTNGEPGWGASWTGGKYLVSPEDVIDWKVDFDEGLCRPRRFGGPI